MQTLEKMEKIGHGLDLVTHKPAQKIKIIETIVIKNPFREAISQILKKDR